MPQALSIAGFDDIELAAQFDRRSSPRSHSGRRDRPGRRRLPGDRDHRVAGADGCGLSLSDDHPRLDRPGAPPQSETPLIAASTADETRRPLLDEGGHALGLVLGFECLPIARRSAPARRRVSSRRPPAPPAWQGALQLAPSTRSRPQGPGRTPRPGRLVSPPQLTRPARLSPPRSARRSGPLASSATCRRHAPDAGSHHRPARCPILISGWANRALSPAITISASRGKLMAAPKAMPSTAAMSGFGKRSIARQACLRGSSRSRQSRTWPSP